ncbi:MAG TPA: ABC transporter ATP-binding protein, partial [Chloroflexota bacterium]|nr:ABC transporter ATP-binding protein [Chloroflexota bacterium]
TVIYVTHDQVEAMTMGHRIAVMRDGILQQLDTPQVLYDRPSNMFVAGFIGSPSMNFFEGTVSGTDSELWVEAGTLKLRVPDHRLAQVKAAVGREVVFGIRPEDIHHPMDRRDAPDHQKAKVTVEVVEPLGSEQFVYLRSGAQEFTSRMSSRAQLAAGNNVDVVFDTEKMHVFDKQTEMALA